MIARIIRLPVVLFLTFLIAGSAAQGMVPLLIGIPSFEVAMGIGSAMLAGAAIIGSAALFEMKKHGTTVEPGQRPAALVTTGIFSFSRNPLYLTLLLVLAALAVMADSLWLLVATALFWLLLNTFIVRSEERLLEETFAEEYATYKRRVRRWL